MIDTSSSAQRSRAMPALHKISPSREASGLTMRK